MKPINALIDRISANGQDFEFYPTTDEIIAALARDIKRQDGGRHGGVCSALDIGAGNGKVLLALRELADVKDLHAIEKSTILCEQLPADILIVGTEFAEQSLLSKHVDLIFSNPPYSDFEEWAVKIIRQAASALVYLVLPERWEKSEKIADALRYRDAKCVQVGKFDFLNAEDRTARAKVHLLRVSLHMERHSKESDDAFERFFNEQFAGMVGGFKSSEKAGSGEKAERFTDLVVGPSYIESLAALYDAELANVQRNFDLVAKLDANLLREFNISPPTVMACLKTRLAGLRSDYWNELFSRLDTVTNRLTSTSRKRLLEVLHRHVHVDFTVSNAYAVIIWVIKNANLYIDSQLLETYGLMVDKCNAVLYKSNLRTWIEDGWRYSAEGSKNTHFGLDYRIVTHRLGGMHQNYSGTELSENAGEFIGDLLTLARNLGFKCETSVWLLGYTGRREWVGGQCYEFHATDRQGKAIILFDVRAYKNRNLHLRLAKSFIMALNVEHGRLKGWLHTREQAADELKDPAAAEYFRANALLTSSATLLLAPPAPEPAPPAKSRLQVAMEGDLFAQAT